MNAEYLYNNYSTAGFTFSKDMISNYAISLYTKPFVIISGISGTGKSKIAQLFQPYFGDTTPDDSESNNINNHDIDKQYITLTITEGILNGDGRGNFKQEDLPLLLSSQEFEEYKKEREQLREKDIYDNFAQTYWITIVGDGDVKHKISVYVQRAISPLIRVRFKSKRSDKEQYNLQPYLKSRYRTKDIIQFEKIGEKTFKIVKVDSEETIKEERSTKTMNYDNNVCFIPVKSDWTDPSGLLGYYNVIGNKYHIGPFLKHLLYANENPDIPFFVILDEMNLSKIEYYLSDVLSVLETRLPGNDGKQLTSTEKIILHSAASSDEYIDTDDEYFDYIPAKIGIPDNLYITGTINIDETTYMPSPKVLDRANVIEFNLVDLDNYFNSENTVDNSTFILNEVPDYSKPVLPSQRQSTLIPEKAKSLLIKINDVLKGHNLHFGYRIAAEISLYITHALKYVGNSETILNIALDYQMVQKILPRINGSQAKIEKAIVELFCLLTNEKIDYEDIDQEKIGNFDELSSSYPLTIRKIKSILAKLSVYGFASFIE